MPQKAQKYSYFTALVRTLKGSPWNLTQETNRFLAVSDKSDAVALVHTHLFP